MPRKNDFYTQQAKRRGYPARSVFKLEEMQEKHAIFGPKDAVLDIGSAPGSWSLYVLRHLTGKGSLVSVDPAPLTIGVPQKTGGGPAFHPIQADAFTKETRTRLQELGPFDTILSDVAPATTGNRVVDSGRSESLVDQVLALAPEVLNPDGNLVVKLFQGSGQQAIMKQMGSLFRKVKTVKPKASRNESFEVFLVGIGYRDEIE